MKNVFAKFPLWECSKDLAKTALGIIPAEMVITNGKLINVCTKEILDKMDIAITKGRIAKVGDCSALIGENTKVIDAKGMYIAPTFLDGHMHIESSMMKASDYAKAVIPHGTSGVFYDPHEMCNVTGLEGVKCMMDDLKNTPLKGYMTTPSCVPAVPGFEDTGASIGPEDIKKTMAWEECAGLGEMMNFPGIIYCDEKAHDIINETLKADKIVTGHYSMQETDGGLNAYIATGIRCCHESTREIDSLTKMRLGMYAQLREGSAWKDLKEVVKAVTKHEVDSRFACLISDDNHPHTLISEGHLDHIVRRAIEEGVDTVTAIQMVTINVAQCFMLDHEIGSITPSKCADILIFDDLKKIDVKLVIIDGEIVAKDGKMLKEFKSYTYPESVKHTVRLDMLTENDFKIKAEGEFKKVHAIEIIPSKTTNYDRVFEMKVENGEIKSDLERDILKVAVFERHKRTGNKCIGFTKGFGIKNGALAQTVAHDAHNLIVMGTNDKDMAIAANALIKCGGGLVAVQNGKVIGLVELPIAGLMSESGLVKTAEDVENLAKAWKQVGSEILSPFMTMASLSLACIPIVRMTDKGLVDCVNFKFIDIIEK